MDKLYITVKSPFGFEPLLQKELTELGVSDLKEGRRMVSGTADLETLYNVMLHTRLALRVLVSLKSAPVKKAKDVYTLASKINWSNYFSVDKSFAIDSVSFHDAFSHSGYPALLVKDAIADHFRKVSGKRPDVDVQHPDVKVHIHVGPHKATIYLDAGGSSLHLRGYKSRGGLAPVSEVLAAGLIDMTGWDGSTLLLDPMCGSGTILAEALMKRCHIPAQYFRRDFAFHHWLSFDENLWETVRDRAKRKITLAIPMNIQGGDKEGRSVRDTLNNLSKLPHSDFVQVERGDFFHMKKPEGEVTILTNPPYDERLPLEDTSAFYQQIGDTLKQKYKGCSAWILSPKNVARKNLGLKPGQRYEVYNGKIQCELINYQVF